MQVVMDKNKERTELTRNYDIKSRALPFQILFFSYCFHTRGFLSLWYSKTFFQTIKQNILQLFLIYKRKRN